MGLGEEFIDNQQVTCLKVGKYKTLSGNTGDVEDVDFASTGGLIFSG